MATEIIIRGKRIAQSDLFQIHSVIQENWNKGRTVISRELCRLWDWRQANGVYKDQVCRIVLRKLKDKGLITLPPSKTGITNHPKRRYYIPPDPPPECCTQVLEGSLWQFLR